METLKSLIAQKNWSYVNSNITDENFPAPEEIRTKNWKLIKMDKSFSSQEALEKIKKEKCTPANIYELVQFAIDNPEHFPKRQWTSVLAFGSEWKDSDGYHRMPYVYRLSDGDWRFGLGRFEIGWDDDFCLLAFSETSDIQAHNRFCDKPLDTQTLGEAKSSDILTLSRAIEICKEAGLKVIEEK